MRRLAPIALLTTLIFAGVQVGCGSAVQGDSELTVYVSAPLSGPRSQEGRDIADGARLALSEAGDSAAGTDVVLEVLNDAGGGGWQAARSGANARRATEDTSTIAYIGELDSGATRTSLPITNEAGLLQVSAGAAAEDLTRAAVGSTRVPQLVQPSGSRTFGRVIPSDRVQGQAAGEWMSRLGIGSVEVEGGDSPFATALKAGIESAADPPAITAADPQATYFAQQDLKAKGRSLIPGSSVRSLFGSDALLDQADLTTLRILTEGCASGSDCPAEPRDVRLTSAALDPAQLPSAASGFLTGFKSEYHRDPGRYAAYGYEAMAVVLDSIQRADNPLSRKDVVDAFFATTDRDSILGRYSIDEVGNTTLGELGAYDVRKGRAVPESAPLSTG